MVNIKKSAALCVFIAPDDVILDMEEYTYDDDVHHIHYLCQPLHREPLHGVSNGNHRVRGLIAGGVLPS